MKRTDKRSKLEFLVTALLSVGLALFVFAAAGNSPAYAEDIGYETWTGNITIRKDTTIEKRIRASGNVTLTIQGGVSLTAKMGISVTEGNSLTINGSGTLHAAIERTKAELQGYAGIGGDPKNPTNGRITINGCTINASGGPWAAGIGGGHGALELQHKRYGTGKDITINGGDITARGGWFSTKGFFLFGAGAGIGGSHEGPAENIVINGGTVRAEGGCCLPDNRPTASDIGAGYGSGKYRIQIHGGKVFCAEVEYHYAARIGAGATNRSYTEYNPYKADGVIVIDGGQVYAGGYIGGVNPGNYHDYVSNHIYLSWKDKTDIIRAIGYSGQTTLRKPFLTKEDRVIHGATPNDSPLDTSEWVRLFERTLIPPVTKIHYYIDEDTPYTDLHGEEVITENLYGEDVNFPMVPSSDYGNFLGWYMSWHATDAATANDKVTDKITYGEKLLSDINLYAGWGRVPYTITYKAGQGGLGGDVEETVYSGETYKLKENSALINGGFLPAISLNYYFRNWRVEGETKDLDPGYTFTVTGDKTFVGQWGKRKLKVTFLDEDGTVLKETWVEAGTYWDYVDKPATPTKDPDEQYIYTFKDWTPWTIQIATDSTFTATYNKTPRKNTAKFSEPAQKVSGTLLAEMTGKGRNGLNISWSSVKGADGYDIFLGRCSGNGKKYACRKVKTIKGGRTLKWTKTGLKKGTSYKAYVKAYVLKDGRKTYVRTSPTIHAYTGGGSRKYTNAGSVTVTRTKLKLGKGKTFRIKAKANKLKKNRKLMQKSHVPKLRYMTSDSKVAAVNSRGRIIAKGKGTCYVYVFAHNGVSKRIRVTVK